jgi:hypothetical protein
MGYTLRTPPARPVVHAPYTLAVHGARLITSKIHTILYRSGTHFLSKVYTIKNGLVKYYSPLKSSTYKRSPWWHLQTIGNTLVKGSPVDATAGFLCDLRTISAISLIDYRLIVYTDMFVRL